VAAWLKKSGSNVRFPIIVPEDDKFRLPKEIEEWRTPVPAEALYSGFSYISNYVPALRLTDLRTGTVPFELWQALAEGLGLFLPRHPLLSQVWQRTEQRFSSLSILDIQLRQCLTSSVKGRSSNASVLDFWTKIWHTCIVGRENAASAEAEISSGSDSSSVSRTSDNLDE
jgi:hypothetical protein